MIVSKSHECPYRDIPHQNLAFVKYYNGHWCYGCNRGELKKEDYYSFRSVPTDKWSNIDINLDSAINDIKDFPNELLAWLYKYYIFDEKIYKNKIMYIKEENKEDSLIFPILFKNSVIAYQRRYFPSKKFFSLKTNQCIFEVGDYLNSNKIILVEDYISAIRVGEVENCICLFGTSLNKNLLEYLISHYAEINIWLDPDEAGQKNSKKIITQLEKAIKLSMKIHAFSIREQKTIKIINSKEDPKCYSNEEIRRILNA